MKEKMIEHSGDVKESDYDNEYDYNYYEEYLKGFKGRYLERPPLWNEKEEERRRWS